jgi:cytochrome c peroxidase
MNEQTEAVRKAARIQALEKAVARYGRRTVKHELTRQRRQAERNTVESRQAAAAVLRERLGRATTSASRLKLMNRIARIEARVERMKA